MPVQLEVDGVQVEVGEDGSLLDALRDDLGCRSVKDGCSPQGQCGCCTVLVDGVARAACVTPVRRVAGRRVTTFDGLDHATRQVFVDAFTEAGASQCGFCTPGIVVRLAGLLDPTTRSGPSSSATTAGEALGRDRVAQALLAHLCRCTGWQTIFEAARLAGARRDAPTGPSTVGPGPRDMALASVRAGIEGRSPQQVGPDIVAGRGGFADDLAPPRALVAVTRGGSTQDEGASGPAWVLGETVSEARGKAGKVQGRRSGAKLSYPLHVPEGDWDLTLRTTWVEPAFLEPDASWCEPGRPAATPLANGGAFGAKMSSEVPLAAARLSREYARTVRALFSREDVVRWGPKRPPVAAGMRADGSGVVRVVKTQGVSEAIKGGAPGVAVEEVEVVGPRTSIDLRGAGWAEAAVLRAAADSIFRGEVRRLVHQGGFAGEAAVSSPNGARATASVSVNQALVPTEVTVELSCGRLLDSVVLRSYVLGATHMALGWVCSEGIALDESGAPVDLTIRSFGVLRAKDMPPVTVRLVDSGTEAVNGSDAVFAAVAAACWQAAGLPSQWPIAREQFT